MPSRILHRRTTCRPRRGANAIEFALILPALLAIVMGAIDYGWYFHQLNLLTLAARNGARAASVVAADDDPAATGATAVSDYLETLGFPSEPNITVTLGEVAGEVAVTVSIVSDFTPFVGMVPLPAQATALAVMRLEDQS